MIKDEQFMQRCIELSKLGLRKAAPNPSVGCVIAHQDLIIGEGFTSPYGGAHAEVNAINSVARKELLAESTVYVSLEPCSHHGKTPPCSDLLIDSDVKRVVVGCKDPFSEVNGAGIAKLKNAGIEVTVGVLEKKCEESHQRFVTYHEKKRPYVILKWAETADGFVDYIRAKKETPLKITSSASSTFVHKWRTEEAAILVGKNTVLLDDPMLTARKFDGPNPIRIILDTEGNLPNSSQVFSADSQTLVFTMNCSYKNNNAMVTYVADLSTETILKELHQRGVSSVFVEGGPTVHQSFFESGNWDEIRRFVSSESIGQGVPALRITNKAIAVEEVGSDKLMTYRNI